jgi:hypothetical protein
LNEESIKISLFSNNSLVFTLFKVLILNYGSFI